MMKWNKFFGFAQFPKREFIKDYEKLAVRKIPKSKPIFELEFLILDTETTGLNVNRDYILSFGSVHVAGYRIYISSAQEYYLRPKKRNKEAIAIHGLVEDRPYISREELLRIFVREASGRILVGHHVGFDLAMLEKLGRSFGLRKIKNPVLDTFQLAIRLEFGKFYDPGLVVSSAFALDHLCDKNHITLDDRHTAAGDAFLTSQLLVKMLKQAEKKGIKTFGDLMA
ncbi:MAG: 3'-5' exonuclease [Cyclobacteriaceae bacterium]